MVGSCVSRIPRLSCKTKAPSSCNYSRKKSPGHKSFHTCFVTNIIFLFSFKKSTFLCVVFLKTHSTQIPVNTYFRDNVRRNFSEYFCVKVIESIVENRLVNWFCFNLRITKVENRDLAVVTELNRWRERIWMKTFVFESKYLTILWITSDLKILVWFLMGYTPEHFNGNIMSGFIVPSSSEIFLGTW